MDEKQINKANGWMIVIIIGYQIIGVFIPMLIWGVVGLVAFRVFGEYLLRLA